MSYMLCENKINENELPFSDESVLIDGFICDTDLASSDVIGIPEYIREKLNEYC